MGQKLMVVSDRSGVVIDDESKHAKVRISFPNSDKVTELDFTVEEAQEIAKGAGNVKRRPGRPPGSKNKPKTDGSDTNGATA